MSSAASQTGSLDSASTADLPGQFPRGSRSSLFDRLIILLPLVLVSVVLTCSPNYHSHGDARQDALGGDFLQDWVGGSIIAGPAQSQLYDVAYFRAEQHDVATLGFTWPEGKFYPPVYPPFFYLAVSPLASLEYRYAMLMWGLLSACAMVAAGQLLRSNYEPFRKQFKWLWIGALVFGPTIYSFNIGHKSMLLLLILTATFVLLHRERPLTAGIVFGLLAFKPHLALVIGLAMLLKCKWRFVAGSTITVATLCSVSLVIGPALCADYLQICLGMGNYVQAGGYQLESAYSLWGVVQMMMPGSSPGFVKAVTMILSAAVTGMLAYALKGKLETESGRFPLQFAALVLGTVLLSPHFYYYDLTIVLLAVFLIVPSAVATLPAASLVRANSPGGVVESHEFNSQMLLGAAIAFLLLAGTFATVARIISFQPGVLLIAAMIGMIAFRHRRTSAVRGIPA